MLGKDWILNYRQHSFRRDSVAGQTVQTQYEIMS